MRVYACAHVHVCVRVCMPARVLQGWAVAEDDMQQHTGARSWWSLDVTAYPGVGGGRCGSLTGASGLE